ncbi:MAG: hypothetical protein U9R58_03185 [Chloroflexota bacterium]|nr:hypothetical protein [Chloroflexota bacterium]
MISGKLYQEIGIEEYIQYLEEEYVKRTNDSYLSTLLHVEFLALFKGEFLEE